LIRSDYTVCDGTGKFGHGSMTFRGELFDLGSSEPVIRGGLY
jgi:hypothetical protein